jgi:hypothetical protein
MALLCQRLGVSWACLTALSEDGQVFQHIGAAFLAEGHPSQKVRATNPDYEGRAAQHETRVRFSSYIFIHSALCASTAAVPPFSGPAQRPSRRQPAPAFQEQLGK